MVWFATCNVLFCSTFMVSNKKSCSLSRKFSAFFMIAALLWLTISTPFVFRAQQAYASQADKAMDQSPLSGNEEESNPFSSSTEEKAPSPNVVSEEFLHDCHVSHYFGIETFSFHLRENAGTYIAFHGELLVPPPNAA